MSAIVKIGYTENEPLAENFTADVDWINANRVSLYETYGSCVLLVYHKEIIGRGADLEEAVSDAELRLKDASGVITPVIKYLSSPYRIGLLRKANS